MKAGGGGGLPRTNPPTQKPPSPPMSGKGTLGYVAMPTPCVQLDVRDLNVFLWLRGSNHEPLQMDLVAPSFIITSLFN